jgi:hypothetical protein
MKKGDEGRRHISGKAAHAAADDRAAADSEQAGQRDKDPVATAARATPGSPRPDRIVPLECSPLITSTPRTLKKNRVKRERPGPSSPGQSSPSARLIGGRRCRLIER